MIFTTFSELYTLALLIIFTYQKEKHIESESPPGIVGLIIFTRFCLKFDLDSMIINDNEILHLFKK